jgi:hypothetical protein
MDLAEGGNPHWREIPSELVPMGLDRRLVIESLQRIWAH